MDLAAEEHHLLACIQDAESLLQRLTQRLLYVRALQHQTVVADEPEQEQQQQQYEQQQYEQQQHEQQQQEEEVPQQIQKPERVSSRQASRRSSANGVNGELEREVREEFSHSASSERRGSAGLAKNRIALFNAASDGDGEAQVSLRDERSPANGYTSNNNGENEEDVAQREQFLQSSSAERRGSAGLTKNRIAMFNQLSPSEESSNGDSNSNNEEVEQGGSSVRAMSPARVSIHAGEGVDNSSKLSLKERIAMFNKEQQS